MVATREGGVDRNKREGSCFYENKPSPPARVAWIETLILHSIVFNLAVATREGGVDRNSSTVYACLTQCTVATREGGVDRNKALITLSDSPHSVATREGGVDRN